MSSVGGYHCLPWCVSGVCLVWNVHHSDCESQAMVSGSFCVQGSQARRPYQGRQTRGHPSWILNNIGVLTGHRNYVENSTGSRKNGMTGNTLQQIVVQIQSHAQGYNQGKPWVHPSVKPIPDRQQGRPTKTVVPPRLLFV